jgi:hypothetical protein
MTESNDLTELKPELQNGSKNSFTGLIVFFLAAILLFSAVQSMFLSSSLKTIKEQGIALQKFKENIKFNSSFNNLLEKNNSIVPSNLQQLPEMAGGC